MRKRRELGPPQQDALRRSLFSMPARCPKTRNVASERTQKKAKPRLGLCQDRSSFYTERTLRNRSERRSWAPLKRFDELAEHVGVVAAFVRGGLREETRGPYDLSRASKLLRTDFVKACFSG
jgi:hypothetical protein